MTLTTDEKRALAFIALLIFLSAALRLAATPEPVGLPTADVLDLGAHTDATREAVAERERRERPLAEGERIDPNTATADELQRLPRVGAALAGRIVEDRERNGRYRTAADLARVAGVGDRMVERLAPHLELRAAPGSAGGRGGARRARPAGRPAEAPLDLNAADAAALATLPGIGPVLAARVVAYRDSAGPFRAVEALAEVKGIGPATLERIRPRVRVYR